MLTQADLDAPWGKKIEKKADEPAQTGKGGPIGFSQTDLDVLLGLEAAKKGEECPDAKKSAETGFSQADLDALWGGLTEETAEATAPAKPEVTVEPTPAASIGENLSQDDIDKLLEEMLSA